MNNPNHTQYTTDRPRHSRVQARTRPWVRTRAVWFVLKPKLQFYRDMAVGPVVIGGVMWIIW